MGPRVRRQRCCTIYISVFTWKQGHEHETPLNSTQSAFNLALGHAGRSRRTWWTLFERTFATTSSLQEQQERRQIVWDCFSRVRKNYPLAHTSGLDACRRHAESQSADGGREWVREGELKLQRAEFTWGNDANQAENVARVQIELEESGGFFINFWAAVLLFVLICGLIFPWWAIRSHSKLLRRN